MADNLVNQSLDRRREERAAEQLIQDNVTRLAELATTNMEIWQKYFGFGAQVAHYWAERSTSRKTPLPRRSRRCSPVALAKPRRTVEERGRAPSIAQRGPRAQSDVEKKIAGADVVDPKQLDAVLIDIHERHRQ